MQVHQDLSAKIEGAKVFSVYGKGIGKSTSLTCRRRLAGQARVADRL